MSLALSMMWVAFGMVWDDELSIEKLGTLREYYGQGLGRYLMIRCMQKLYEVASAPDKLFYWDQPYDHTCANSG